jgi:hypothetical protein
MFSVDAGIGTARSGDCNGMIAAEYAREPHFKLALHGPQPGLTLPAVELGAVKRQIDPVSEYL